MRIVLLAALACACRLAHPPTVSDAAPPLDLARPTAPSPDASASVDAVSDASVDAVSDAAGPVARMFRGERVEVGASESYEARCRPCVLEATRATVVAQRELAVKEEEIAHKAILDAGGEIVELTAQERTRFVAAVKPLHDEAKTRFAEAFALL